MMLVRPLDPERPATALETAIHGDFRALVEDTGFVCVAAKGAINRASYGIGVYEDMSSAQSAAQLARDLYVFTNDQDAMESRGVRLSTFVACFHQETEMGEKEYEKRLWDMLQSLHEIDRENCSWDDKVADAADDARFGFSFGRRGYYMIGLHPGASRLSRRFQWPALVFNAHYQFERLKADGRYEPMQSAIRGRDVALQGDVNPMLSDFGERSEARQYSGRSVGDDWECPFHAH